MLHCPCVFILQCIIRAKVRSPTTVYSLLDQCSMYRERTLAHPAYAHPHLFTDENLKKFHQEGISCSSGNSTVYLHVFAMCLPCIYHVFVC